LSGGLLASTTPPSEFCAPAHPSFANGAWLRQLLSTPFASRPGYSLGEAYRVQDFGWVADLMYPNATLWDLRDDATAMDDFLRRIENVFVTKGVECGASAELFLWVMLTSGTTGSRLENLSRTLLALRMMSVVKQLSNDEFHLVKTVLLQCLAGESFHDVVDWDPRRIRWDLLNV